MSVVSARLDRLPAAAAGAASRTLWLVFFAALATGLLFWGAGAAAGSLATGVAALWLFAAAAVAIALVLPFSYALVSPLYVGLVGWLVDMLPLVMLVGWATLVARWAFGLWRERRLPRGGRWLWLPVFLVAWTCTGVLVITGADFKHFLLLVAIQVLSSGVLLVVVDTMRDLESRLRLVTGLVGFVVALTVGVFIEYVGAPVQELQQEEVSTRVEEAYGVDAFPNNLEMIKYGLSQKAGAREFRARMERFARSNPQTPQHEVYLPPFRAFENHLVVRFAGSARPIEGELDRNGVDLVYDNLGLTAANTVPRWRSFARNSLTYAGVCVAIFPLALYLAWATEGRRRLLGRLGVASCLAGAGFSLSRGAWVAILIGVLYLVVDGVMTWRRKGLTVAIYVVAAVLLTGVYLIRYGVDPLNARALGTGSINTRATLYEDTVESITGTHILFGFGTERPRSEAGSHFANRYFPRAGTHSTYLNFLFRLGVPGGIAIVGIYLIAGLHARAASRVRRGDERLFATLIAAAVASVGAHAVILNLFVEPIYTLSVSMVLALATVIAVDLGASVLPWRTRRAQ